MPDMEEQRIEEVLSLAERAVDSRKGLAGSGFWKAVASVKSDPQWVDRFAPRIAEIDRKAFLEWALFTLTSRVGNAVMTSVTLAGALLVVWAHYVPSPWDGLVLLGGAGILVTTTHGLGHQVVGRMAGIRFTHWFVGSLKQPQPGVKVDYDSYLRAAPRARAWMHASGAIVTKLLPFVMLVLALLSDFPSWTAWLFVAQGVLQVITDALWSVKVSDWKKFRREMSYR